MTTGSWANNSTRTGVGYAVYYDAHGNITSQGPFGTSTFGVVSSKTWSGGDGPSFEVVPASPWRYYTVLDVKGKPYRKRFRETPPRRIKMNRGLHGYQMLSVLENHGFASVVANFMGNTSVYSGLSGSYLLGGGFPYCPLPSWTANDEINIINKLAEEIRGGSFNLGVFLAEGGEALDMIANSATRIYRAYRFVKRGKIPEAIRELVGHRDQSFKKGFNDDFRRREQRSLDDVSGNWLQLQYGWKPLLGDIQRGAKQLANRLYLPFTRKYRVRVSKSAITPNTPTGTYRIAYASSVRRHQIIAYVTEEESIPQLIGLTDIELVLWERTPFSFVADWVVPIGDYLSARAAVKRLKGQFVYTKTTIKTCKGVTCDPVNYGYAIYTRSVNADLLGRQVTVDRQVLSQLAVPMPEVQPLFKVASLGHCLNALALLAQEVKFAK